METVFRAIPLFKQKNQSRDWRYSFLTEHFLKVTFLEVISMGRQSQIIYSCPVSCDLCLLHKRWMRKYFKSPCTSQYLCSNFLQALQSGMEIIGPIFLFYWDLRRDYWKSCSVNKFGTSSSVIICAIWYHLYNLKAYEGVLHSVTLKPSEACNFTKMALLHECFSRNQNTQSVWSVLVIEYI